MPETKAITANATVLRFQAYSFKDFTLDQLAEWIGTEKRAAHHARISTLLHVKRAGDGLIEAKKRIVAAHGHGHWVRWLEDNLEWDTTTAQYWMAVARNWRALEAKTERDPQMLTVREARSILAGYRKDLKLQRGIVPKGGNDRVMTPAALAAALAAAFKPSGVILEPSAGTGMFADALRQYARKIHVCEVDHGSDFFDWSDQVDWVFGNPPWSQFRDFLVHSMEIANHVVFLTTINHFWTKSRVNDVRKAKFGYKRLLLIHEHPEGWSKTGFSLGAMHLQKGYKGPLEIGDLSRTEKRLGRPPAASRRRSDR